MYSIDYHRTETCFSDDSTIRRIVYRSHQSFGVRSKQDCDYGLFRLNSIIDKYDTRNIIPTQETTVQQ